MGPRFAHGHATTTPTTPTTNNTNTNNTNNNNNTLGPWNHALPINACKSRLR